MLGWNLRDETSLGAVTLTDRGTCTVSELVEKSSVPGGWWDSSPR